jgi:PAS domain S-box-containing protein
MTYDQPLSAPCKEIAGPTSPFDQHRGMACHPDAIKRETEDMASLLLAAIVDSSDDAIIGKDLNSVITSWNKGAEKIFGYTAREMVGTSITRLIPADRRDEEDHILGKIKSGERVEHFETLRQTRDGRLINVSVTASPITDASGRVVGVSKVARDITARKRAEEALRTSEARLNFALQTSQIGAWELCLQDNTAHRTLIHDRIFGYHTLLPHWTYEMFLEHVLPEDRGEVNRSFLQATAVGGDWSFECRIRRADGEVRWIWAAGGHERNAEGRAVRLSGIVQDITKRKQMEEARGASEARYRALFDYAPDGIVVAGPDGRYIDANASICQMLGYTREELIGLHASDIVVPTEVQHIARALSAIKAGSDYHREWQFRSKDGSTFLAEVIATAMPDGNLLGMIRDITERKRIGEELRVAHEKLQQLLAHSPVVIYTLRIIGQTITPVIVSDNIERLLGYTVQESRNYEWWVNSLHPEDRERVLAIAVQNSLRKSYTIEYRLRHKDGTYRWVQDDNRTGLDGSKQQTAVGVLTDITERKQAEEEIQNQLKELQRWHEVMLGREERVIELKREVNKLLVQQKSPPRYSEGVIP